MIGDRIREMRQKKDWTQEELSQNSDVPQRNITRYENNVTVPDADVLAKIAHALHVSTDFLVGLTDNPSPLGDQAGDNPTEKMVINALRRGNKLEAVKAIVNGG